MLFLNLIKILHFDPLRGLRPMCELSFLLFNCVCIGSIGLVGADNASTEEGDSLSRLPAKLILGLEGGRAFY